MVRMMSPFFLHPKHLGYHLGRNYQSQTPTAEKKHFTLIMLYIKSWQIRTAAATGLIKLQFFLLLYLIVVFTMASGRKTTTQFPGVRTIRQSSRTRIELIPRNHQIGWFFWGIIPVKEKTCLMSIFKVICWCYLCQSRRGSWRSAAVMFIMANINKAPQKNRKNIRSDQGGFIASKEWGNLKGKEYTEFCYFFYFAVPKPKLKMLRCWRSRCREVAGEANAGKIKYLHGIYHFLHVF